MKMFLIIYCEAADEDVIAALKEAGIRGYTKTVEARGEGTETEPKLGTHCWPGKNNVLFMALPDEDIPRITERVRRLKQEHPRAGVRSFILPMEENE
ncbi:MAG: PG0541 family transporter-associated protein [Syntrophales bacterium]